MCTFRKKSKLFRYFLCLIAERNPIELENGTLALPEDFTNTKLMKLLYCLCLESCFDESGNVADDMNDENLHLFTYFDYFMAYDNGPLERDIYEHITCLEGVKYEDGRIVAVDMFQTEDFNRNIELFLPLETAFRRIAAKGLLDLTVARLIELTHRLPLWRNAYNYGSTKDMNVNPFNIKMECDDYADMVNDNAA